MAFTGRIKTDQNPSKLFSKGHTFTTTSINNTVNQMDRFYMGFQLNLRHSSAVVDQRYNFLDTGATEPASDAKLATTAFSGTPTTYSATVPGYVKSWTSDTGIFSSNQDFDTHNVQWTVTFNAYYSGTPTSGYTVYCRFEFYKRNSSNVDTFLFQTNNQTISTLNNEQTINIVPTGSVTTADRLRIRVYIGESLPS